MLTADYRSSHADDIDGISNYYESMVRAELARQLPGGDNADLLADIACVALNHLPPRYVRHAVDMAFYLSPREQQEMEEKVTKAVQAAIAFVQERGGARQ